MLSPNICPHIFKNSFEDGHKSSKRFMRRSTRNFNILPRAKSGHLNFWRLDRSNSSPLGPKECSNDLSNDRICPSGAVVGYCRLLWSLCINMPTHVSWLFTWYCRLQKQNFIVETNFIDENVFPSVKFGESLYTSWQRCLLHDIIFWQNFIGGFLFLIKNRKV